MSRDFTRRWIKHILLVSLIIASIAAVLMSIYNSTLSQYILSPIYLIYLPSVMLLFIALHNQYIKRDILGLIAVISLFVLILFNILYGGVI